MTNHQKRIPTAQAFEEERDSEHLKQLDNMCARLSEKMGGMNRTDQSYDMFDIIIYLLRTARKEYKEALEAIKLYEANKNERQ